MSDHETLIETESTPISDGIFTAIAKNYGEELPEYLTDTQTLNIGYYYQHSGNKLISPLVRHFVKDKILDDDSKDKIAKVILAAYKDSWNRAYRALTADYSPIENVEEFYTETTEHTGKTETSNTGTNSGTDNHAYTGSDTKTNTGTDTTAQSGTDTTTNTGTTTTAQGGTDTITNTGTVTDAQTGTDTTTNSGTQENKNVNKDGTSETINGLAGFNSDEYNKDNKSTTTVNQTITDTRTDNLKSALEHGLTDTRTDDTTNTTNYGRTDTQTDNTTQAIQHGLTDTRTLDTSEKTVYNNNDDETINLTTTNSGTEDSSGKDDITRHRHGNVGVTTNQYMITEEMELRKKYFILNTLYGDVDKMMTIPIY